MSEIYGYQNCVLRFDLTNRKFSTEPLNMDWARKYIGCKGLSIKYLYEELEPGIDPLGPDNKLYFTTGPVTGTSVPCSGKLSVTGKSPATGTMCDCSMGGHAAVKIKQAGYDMIVLEGQLDKPGYILIEDDKVEILDADDLWGKGSHETEAILAEKYGFDHAIISIGPSGENLGVMSCINSDYYRQAGRGGMGAVMGSKKVKALVIKGTKGVKVPDAKKMTERVLEFLQEDCLQEDNTYVYDTGTTAFAEGCGDGGIAPYKNFSDTTDPNLDKYNGDVLLEYRVGKRGCGSCGLGCGNFIKWGDAIVEGPEWETMSVAGGNAGACDPEMILKYNQVADDMGLDTISAGDTLVWAMEMTERGIHDFGIRFGESDKEVEYLKLMARMEGVGKDLAMGVKKCAEKYGGEEFAMHCKGLEFPQYEPRGSWGMALAYAVSSRGACHMTSYMANDEVFEGSIPAYSAEGKGEVCYGMAEWNNAKFSMCICDFWATCSYEIMTELLELATGQKYTLEEFGEVGRRVTHLGRAFNNREGFTRKEDSALPERLFTEKLKTGPAAGQVIPKEDFESMLDQYYDTLGWTRDGVVPEEILKTL